MSHTTVGRNEWPHFLADLKEKRDALTEVITILETKFSIPDDDGAIDHADPPVARGKKRMARVTSTRRGRLKKAASGTDGRTDGRSKARATSPGSAEPP